MTSHIDLAQRLIQRAARNAPGALAARLEEEWLADLAARSGTLARLRLAIGCWWATGVITRDFAVPQVATSGGRAGARALLGEVRADFPILSRRTLTFLLIVGFHLLLIYALASGLAQRGATSLQQITQAVVTQEIRPQRPTPPQVDIHIKSPVIPTTQQDLRRIADFDLRPQDEPATAVPTGPEITATDPPQPPVIQRIQGGPGKGFPNTDDFYPSASRRLAETGATTVQVCVDAEGRLSGDPIIARSSGIRRLDDGALNLAKAGSGHYRPSTENGRPVSSCYPYRIRFSLHD